MGLSFGQRNHTGGHWREWFDTTCLDAFARLRSELNIYLPVIGYTVLQSVDLLAGAVDSFNDHCASGIEANRDRIEENLHRSLMLVTALNPHIGCDNAADVAKTAWADGKSLREVVVEKGLLSGERFDEVVVPARMARPSD